VKKGRTKIPFTPTEISWKDQVGVSVSKENLSEIPQLIHQLLSDPEKYKKKISDALEKNIFNVGSSGLASARYIHARLIEKQKEKKQTKNK
ncbi:MAG: hypothetical protein II225_04965, partial [Ruminococcus sp.]|nr:hypothetical protein [Ruminococcus sp.]